MVKKLCTLRQSVILISIIDTLMSAIYLMLLLLGGQHAQNMTQMVDEDVWSVAHDDTLPRANNNGVRMHLAQKMAYVTLDTIRMCIFMMAFHLVCSICLLYGAVMRHKEVLTLWLGSMMVMIFASVSLLVYVIYMDYDTKDPFLCLLFTLGTLVYSFFWILTFKYHRQLSVRECRLAGNDAITTRLKSNVIQSEKDAGPISKPQYV